MSPKSFSLFSIAILLFALGGIALAVDTDGDGLQDNVEARLGSSPLHKDIFVEIDWLIVNGRNTKPRGNFVQIVTSVFASAPVNNPDGTRGIRLHVVLSNGIRSTKNVIGTQNANGSYNWAEFDQIKARYFNNPGTHHYCLFVRDYAAFDQNGNVLGSSGLSRNANGAAFRQGASDFIVALGGAWWNEPRASLFKWTQAGTFLHELGHNLGLMHGGNDHISFKPNHLSLMSYSYQTDGIPFTASDGTRYYLYDYNRIQQFNLNENRVNEATALGSRARTTSGNYGARWYLTNDYSNFFVFEDFDATVNVDWNQNGSISNNVKVDLNPNFPFRPPSSSFKPFITLIGGPVEWTRIRYNGGQIGRISAASLPQSTDLKCLNIHEYKSIRRSSLKSNAVSAVRGTFMDLIKK